LEQVVMEAEISKLRHATNLELVLLVMELEVEEAHRMTILLPQEMVDLDPMAW
jgi:hypothetical protein